MSKNPTAIAAPAGPLFPLGQRMTTPGIRALGLAPVLIAGRIHRHTTGQRDRDADDIQRNIDAIQAGGRVFGAFQLDDQTRIWVITESDRSRTGMLLPDAY